MYGSLTRENLKSGMLTGKCYVTVEGQKLVDWVSRQAQEEGLTESRICRNLLNEMIKLKMAEECSKVTVGK